MTTGQKLEGFLFLVIVALLLFFAAGCVETLPPETKAKIDAIQNQEKVDAAAAKAKIDALEQQAKAKPTSHPIEWANLIIGEVRGPLILVGSIATLAFFIGIGLWAASLFAVALKALLSGIAYLVAPIAGCVAVGCWGTLTFLPWAPWIIGGCVALGLTLFLIRLSQVHWKITNLFTLHEVNATAITKATGMTPQALATKPVVTINPPGSANAPIST